MKDEILDRILIKTKKKIAVSEFWEEETKVKKEYKWQKIVAMLMVTIGISSGLAYATATIYEKVWKEPKEYKINQGITEEEKRNCISKEEAEKIGKSYLTKIGFEDQSILELELENQYRREYDIVWELRTSNIHITIDATTGKIKYVYIPSTQYQLPKHYGITREQARTVARELLEKYKPEDMDGEYELISLRRNAEIDQNAYIWYADFYKKYGDLVNENEHINIGWIPTVNGLYSLDIQNDQYENNEEIVTKEEAIKIATEKDGLITQNRKIKTIEAEIRIKQMNEQVFLRENFTEEYEKGILNYEKVDGNLWKLKEDATFYETEGRVRKVWSVVLEYETYGKGQMPLFTYYVDATTGEIIGGNTGNEFESERTLKNDPGNVIKKCDNGTEILSH